MPGEWSFERGPIFNSGIYMLTGLIHGAASFLGGVYFGDVVWKKSRDNSGYLPTCRISKFAVATIQSKGMGDVIYKTFFFTVMSHGFFAVLTKYIDSKRRIGKLVGLLKTSIGTYEVSISFFMGTAMTLHSRKNSSEKQSPLSNLFNYILSSSYNALFANHFKLIRDGKALAEKVDKFTKKTKETVIEISNECSQKVREFVNKEQSEAVKDVLAHGKEFAEHLENWPELEKKLQKILKKYRDRLNQVIEDLGTQREIHKKEVAEFLQTIESAEEDKKSELFSTLFGTQSLKNQVNSEFQESKTKLKEIDQLILKTQHLLKGIELITKTNETEYRAFKLWDDAVKLGEIGGFSTATIWDYIFRPQTTSPAQGDESEHIRSIAEDSSATSRQKRENFNRSSPELMRSFHALLKGLHSCRNNTLKKLEYVHLAAELAPVTDPNLTDCTEEYVENLINWKKFFVELHVFQLLVEPKLSNLSAGCKLTDESNGYNKNVDNNEFSENWTKLHIKNKIRESFLAFFSTNNMDFVKEGIADFEKLSNIGRVKAIRNKIANDKNIQDKLANASELILGQLDFLILEEYFDYFKNVEKLTIEINSKFLSTFRKFDSLKECHITNYHSENFPESSAKMIPEFLKNSKNLEYLHLINFKNVKTLPPWISDFKNLKVLNLDNTSIAIFPEKIIELQNLTALSLIGNQITEIPKQINELKQLQNLNLSESKIVTFPKEITEIDKLKSVWLFQTNILKIPTWIKNLSEFEDVFKEMEELEEKELHENQFIEETPIIETSNEEAIEEKIHQEAAQDLSDKDKCKMENQPPIVPLIALSSGLTIYGIDLELEQNRDEETPENKPSYREWVSSYLYTSLRNAPEEVIQQSL